MKTIFARAHALTKIVLDPLSQLTLVLSAIAMIVLALIVFLQVAGRQFGFSFVWGSDVASYALVATTFLAMAPTLRHGLHIRVSLVIERVPARGRLALEIWSYAIGVWFTTYAAYWCIVQVIDSRRFGDVSIGMIPFQLWIPQSFLAIGFTLLALAMLEGLFAVLAGISPTAKDPADDGASSHY